MTINMITIDWLIMMIITLITMIIIKQQQYRWWKHWLRITSLDNNNDNDNKHVVITNQSN